MGSFDSYVPAIKKFEGFTPRATWDYKQHSNGYGTRAKFPGEVIDQNTANQRFDGEFGKAAGMVGAFAPDAPEGVKAALSSLTYNAGNKWMNSGLGQAVRRGDYDSARRIFTQYNRAGGRVNAGLVSRRNQEAAWFDGSAPANNGASTVAPRGMAGGVGGTLPVRMALGGPAPASEDAPGYAMNVGANLAAISPEFARDVADVGGRAPGGMAAGPGTASPYSSDEEDAYLQSLASNTLQPYRSGWAALPGVGSSIVGGMAAGKLAQNARAKQTGDATALRRVVGMAGNNPGDFLDVASSAPPGGMAQKFALQRAMKLQEQEAKRSDPGYQLGLEKARLDIENARSKPEFQVIGRDAYGQPTYGWTNARTQSVTPAAGTPPSSGALQPPPGEGLSGDAFLKTLQPQEANEIKALAEGRMQIPGGFALKSPYWQRKMSQLSQYDPNFDTVNYNARAATRKDFTSGKSAQNITSFNTAIGHLGHLKETIEALDNSDYVAVNAAKNATASVNSDRAAKLADFGTARNAVTEELTRAFKGTGGSLTEVEGWEKLLDPNASKAAQLKVVKRAVDLLASRIDSVGEQYNKGMGTTSDPITLLTPKAQKIWKTLNPQADEVGEAAPAAPSSAGPGVDPRKVPAGQVFDYRGHKIRALGNGQFEKVQ